MSEKNFHSPAAEHSHLQEKQTEAFKQFEREKGLVVRLLGTADKAVETAGLDYIRDDVTNLLMRADKDQLKTFVDSFQYRYAIYANSVKSFFRTPEIRGKSLYSLEDEKHEKQEPSIFPLMAASALDRDVRATDRTAYHADLLVKLEKKMEASNIPSKYRQTVLNMLKFVKLITAGWGVNEAAREIGLDGPRANRVYVVIRERYPEIFGKLPYEPSELKPGSAFWGGTGKSTDIENTKIINEQRRQDMMVGLRALLEDLNQAGGEEEHYNLTHIGGKDLAVKVIRYYLEEIPRSELEISANTWVLQKMRAELAKELGLDSLPIRISDIEREKKKFISYAELKNAVRAEGISNRKEYLGEYPKHSDWPADPVYTYADEWTDWFDFLGKEKTEFLPMEKLKEEVKFAKIKNKREYAQAKKDRPSWPSMPETVYGEQWPGWRKFLETDFPSFDELQTAVRAIGVKSGVEYRQLYESKGWPSNPHLVYKEQWPDWPKFLGKE